MVELGIANQGIPERLHPKSFHANFAHNTNVWATRNKQVDCHNIIVMGCCGRDSQGLVAQC